MAYYITPRYKNAWSSRYLAPVLKMVGLKIGSQRNRILFFGRLELLRRMRRRDFSPITPTHLKIYVWAAFALLLAQNEILNFRPKMKSCANPVGLDFKFFGIFVLF